MTPIESIDEIFKDVVVEIMGEPEKTIEVILEISCNSLLGFLSS